MVKSDFVEGNSDESGLCRKITAIDRKDVRPKRKRKQAAMVVAILGLITSCYTRL
jgi:hypothetical protein